MCSSEFDISKEITLFCILFSELSNCFVLKIGRLSLRLLFLHGLIIVIELAEIRALGKINSCFRLFSAFFLSGLSCSGLADSAFGLADNSRAGLLNIVRLYVCKDRDDGCH